MEMEKKLTTTMIMITIASNCVIPSVLYVFLHCHHHCLLLSLSFVCSLFFIFVYLRANRGEEGPSHVALCFSYTIRLQTVHNKSICIILAREERRNDVFFKQSSSF